MKLEIRWHPRLGDAIVCRGLFRHWLKEHSPTDVVVPATQQALPSIRHLYGYDAQEFGAQLFIQEVPDDPREHTFYRDPFWQDSVKVTVGGACPEFEYEIWDQSFYEQAGVDPAERFKCYNGPESFPPDVFNQKTNQRAYLTKQRRQGRKLALLHETRDKRLPFEVKKRYAGRMDWKVLNLSGDLGPSLLNWAPIIADVDEMHMVDSGPANLANSIMAGGSTLVIYAQDTPPPSMLHPGGRVTVVYSGAYKPCEK